ncbi:MAG TPA: efflux transporter outer membrane subunit [Thermoanaerobaculia bacterium]|nr:efflux transporter outer membrane subunit [Thermoanaerobaculia bacterium]
MGTTNARLTAAVLSALLAGGCVSFEPKVQLPPPPIQASWPLPETTVVAPPPATEPAASESVATATAPVAAPDIGWRDFFADERLEQLIALALEGNRDFRTSVLNVARFRALYDIRRADRVPSVDATVSGARQRLPSSQTGGDPATVSSYALEVGTTAYELDLFGRVRSLSHEALEQYFASEENRRGAQLALIAAVADQYLAVAADRELLHLAEETVKSQEQSFGLTEKRHELGAVSGLDLAQERTTVESARVDAARFAGEVDLDVNALQLLVGAPIDPALLPERLDDSVASIAALPPGLPSEVLLRRPDVLAAEHVLRGANASIGAARAAYFPRISLTALFGRASDDLGDLFSSGSGTWSFLPQVTVPIFQGGRLRANRRAAEVERDIAVAQYEGAIQTGFREVADALALDRSLARQREAQQALTDAAARAYDLSRERYQAGRDSYLVALDSQRIHYGAQQGLIVIRLAEQRNRVELYRVLGGGWKERTE